MRIVASPCHDEMNCAQDILQKKIKYAKQGKKTGTLLSLNGR